MTNKARVKWEKHGTSLSPGGKITFSNLITKWTVCLNMQGVKAELSPSLIPCYWFFNALVSVVFHHFEYEQTNREISVCMGIRPEIISVKL